MDMDLPDGLREATDADADRLVTLIGGVFDEYPGCVIDLDDLDADLLAVRTAFARRGGRLWVVERDDRIVACVGYGPTSSTPHVADLPGRTIELKRLYVHADARGAGLGSALVDLVHRVGVTTGADGVELWSDTRFHHGHRRYLAAGYEQRPVERDLEDPSHSFESAFWRPLPRVEPTAEVVWVGEASRERARLVDGPLTHVLAGTVVADVQWDWEVETDERWRTRAVRVRRDGRPHLHLGADGLGRWWRDGERADDLDGCLDVDLTITPATNALVVRRLLAGQTLDGPVAWWDAGSGRVVAHDQGYEQLDDRSWRFTSPGFSAELTVDEHGLVNDYPGLFRRA